MGKDAFTATNFVLVPITSLSQGPMSQGHGSQGPRSQVPGPGSHVLILDYAQCKVSWKMHLSGKT